MIVSRSRTVHLQSPSLTIGRTVLKESDDLVILGVTFDSKVTFEKHLRSVSSVASQRLCILRKSWRVFHDRSLIERCSQAFVLPVLKHCSVIWFSAADTHLKLLDRAVSDDRFLTGGVFECDIAHRRSVAVLCMLYKIRCNPMHPLNGALPGPYVPMRVTRGALVARVHWSGCIGPMSHLAAEPRSNPGILFPSQCPSRIILLTVCSILRDWRISRAGPMLLYWPKVLHPYSSFYYFSISLLHV